MANEEQVAILKKGPETWNKWRDKHRGVDIDLSGAKLDRWTNLTEARLDHANLVGANLENAYLAEASLWGANLSEANLTGIRFYRAWLSGANFNGANLSSARLLEAFISGASFQEANLNLADLSDLDLSEMDFSGADLREANLIGSRLKETNFTGANLSGARLINTMMVKTNLVKTNLSGCYIYGISAWNVNLEGAIQSNLIITDWNEPAITVDNLEVAQFIYLLIHNQKLRDVIDTIGKKAVLILGRFTDERLAILQAIREELRRRDYIPILFDFDKPDSRDVTETVGLLAHMARFVIADLTDAKSIPQELSVIVPNLPSVAVQPLILKEQRPYGMFEHWQRFLSVLPIREYETQEQLIAELVEKVIEPAEAKVNELRPRNP